MGPVHALWQLARPRMAPLLWLLPLLGYGWAHWEWRLPWRRPGALVLVLVAWTALHAGTLWLNAGLDHDDDAVLFGSPAPVPPATSWLALAALGLAVLLGWMAAPLAGVAVTACAGLSLLYSHPRTRWKAHPVGGPLVNAVGYGLLSPLAGWAVVGVPATPRTLAVWPLLAVGLLAPTFVAQAWQGPADAARGYRTLVVTHGPQACLRAASLALGVALSWGLLLAAVGVVPRLMVLAAVPWVLVLRWLQQQQAVDVHGAQALVRRMAGATVVTIALGVASLAV